MEKAANRRPFFIGVYVIRKQMASITITLFVHKG